MMNSQTPLKRKTTQSLVARILFLSTLAGVLSACNMIIVTPKPTVEIVMELTPSQDLPATQELTLVSPTEVPTEMPIITLTPELTATFTLEPTATITQTPEPTATKTLDPTATREFSVEEEANMEAVAARMADYLNSTGDFTYEKVREKMYKMTGGIPDKNYWQNGLFRCYNDMTTVEITGFNLGLVILGDRQIIIFGTQDVDARRIVIPVQYMPVGYNNDEVTTGILIGTSDSMGTTDSLIKSKAQFEQIMSEGTGKAFAVQIDIVSSSEHARIGGFEIAFDRIDYAKRGDYHLPANLNMIHSVWRTTRYLAGEGEPFYNINQLIDSTGGNQVPSLSVESLADLKILGSVPEKLPLTSSLSTATK